MSGKDEGVGPCAECSMNPAGSTSRGLNRGSVHAVVGISQAYVLDMAGVRETSVRTPARSPVMRKMRVTEATTPEEGTEPGK